MSRPLDSRDMIPGQEYIIDGHTWAKCGDCKKIIRTDGLFGGLHLCVER